MWSITPPSSEKNEHLTVQQTDNENLDNDWLEDMRIANQYEGQSPDLLQFWIDFKNVWDGYHGRSTIARPQIRLTKENVHLVTSAQHKAEPTARKFAAK